MRRRILTTILLLSILAVVMHIVRTSYKTYVSSHRVDMLEQEIADLHDQNKELEAEIALRQSPLYIEQIARNKLNLVKPNEKLVVVTEDKVSQEVKEEVLRMQEKPPYELWLQLLVPSF
ncbi:septum formation initiator family protein [candidate division WWE3 bacterium]|uniref:Septum formation initiator family protein n=1 Tax=candidate division WWE3 bacterium TaxID=2053526 RepID=A0A955LW66_UNCKA|nr:septum formation initiator family protein [candidate division WWE3 bacterium]